jgi:hypothetical protein
VSLNFPGGARELMDRASFVPGFVICKVIIVLSFDDEE